jgi:hypothetical protein
LKGTTCRPVFRFLRRRNHSATRAIIARNTSPPTTPPATAPASDFDLLADATVVDGVGFSTLVLVVIADDNVEALVASDDQGSVSIVAGQIYYGLLCSAAATLKLLPVCEGNINVKFLYALL